MNTGYGAEPILEVKNLKTHLVYPSPGPSPLQWRGELHERRTLFRRTAVASSMAKKYTERC